MPKIKFIGNWCKQYQEMFSIPKGYLVFKYQDFYRRGLSKALLPLDERQSKKLEEALVKAKERNQGEVKPEEYLRDIEIELTYHYKKRTLDQNALMWSLYAIEANEQNGGQAGHKDQMVQPMDLYLADLEEEADIETITTKRSHLSYYMTEYKIIKSVKVSNGKNEMALKDFIKLDMHDNEQITITAIRGSSKFNTREMAAWIDRLFNRLAFHGVPVTGSGSITKYWHEWKTYLNENKIILNDSVMTQLEYKAFNPICEACGNFISGNEGDLAHIKAIGMGGDRKKEPKRNYTSNWLHLHHEPCHMTDWHKAGYKSFLKKYKHLTYKVNTALNREYKPLENVECLGSEFPEKYGLSGESNPEKYGLSGEVNPEKYELSGEANPEKYEQKKATKPDGEEIELDIF